MASNFFQDIPFLVGLGAIVVSGLFLYFKMSKKSAPKTLLNSEEKYALKLIEKIELSHDTRIFRFGLPSDSHILGLPTGQHVHLSATVNGQLVVRPYTPVSSDEDLGKMDLVIKVYFKDVHPKFPDGGKLTQYINDMKLGDTINVRGPSGRLVYNGRGEFAIKPDKKSEANTVRVKKVNMVAGGSGITPMLQIIKAVFRDEKDDLCLTLLFANQTEEDILCRKDLEEIQKEHPNRFKLSYTLDRPPTDWKYNTGFVSAEMLEGLFFPPADDTLVMMCGPPPMVNFAVNPALDKLGYESKLRFTY